MSKLKLEPIIADDVVWGKAYYEMHEVDDVIANLKAENDHLRSTTHSERWFNLNKQYEGWFGKVMRCKRAERETLHHKYKRCLDKAAWCNSEEKRLEAIAPIFDTDKECWEYNSDYWNKWRERWLKIAEEFKEAK